MNQRPGKTHAAGGNDNANISLRKLVDFVRAASKDLNKEQPEIAYIFDNIEDWLVQDVSNGKPFEYNSRILGI